MIRHQLYDILVEDVPKAIATGVIVFLFVYAIAVAKGDEPPVARSDEPPMAVARFVPVVPPAPTPVTVVPAVRSPVGHTHTCSNGHTWDHSVTAGHECPVCGVSQYVQDAVPRPVTAPPVYSLPGTFSSGGCSTGNCPTVAYPPARRGTFRR